MDDIYSIIILIEVLVSFPSLNLEFPVNNDCLIDKVQDCNFKEEDHFNKIIELHNSSKNFNYMHKIIPSKVVDLINKEVDLINKEVVLINKEVVLIRKEVVLITKEVDLMRKEVDLINLDLIDKQMGFKNVIIVIPLVVEVTINFDKNHMVGINSCCIPFLKEA